MKNKRLESKEGIDPRPFTGTSYGEYGAPQ